MMSMLKQKNFSAHFLFLCFSSISYMHGLWQTILDNIFSNYTSKKKKKKKKVGGNLISRKSVHLLRVSFIPSMFSDTPATKYKIGEKTLIKLSLSWITLIKIRIISVNNNGNKSMENFFKDMNDLLDKHALFKNSINRS